MRVSAGAPKLQPALALPLGVAALSSAVRGPEARQLLSDRPSAVAGTAAHPAAPLGTPVGPLQEKTVYVFAVAADGAAATRTAAAGTANQWRRCIAILS